MDFELATMLAESGLTFQEFRKRGLTKSQLRLTLAKDEDDVDQGARQESVFPVVEKHVPSAIRTATRSAHAVNSPASVAPTAIPVTPKEPEAVFAELTDEMAASVLMQMSRESRSPQTAKRRRVENGNGYGYAEGPSDSYGYGEVPQHQYYQQPAYPGGPCYAPQPDYQAYQAYQTYQPYPYQQQPYQNEYHCGYNYNYNYNYTQPQEYATVAHQGVHPQYQGAYQGHTPSQTILQHPMSPATLLQRHNEEPSCLVRDAKAGTNAAGSVALVSSDNVNIHIANDSNRTNEQTWINHYNRLQEYLVEHGSYPTHSKANPCLLGQWCGRQRKHYRRMGPYKHASSMPSHRIELMELLPGWRWVGAPDLICIKSWTPVRGLKLPESLWRR